MSPFTNVRWPLVPLRRLVDPRRRITYGIVQAGDDVPDGVPYVRPIDMSDEGGVDLAALRRTSPEIASSYRRSMIREGDLVVSIGPSFGKVMEVPAELTGANLTQGTARVSPGHRCERRFLFWVLRSTVAWEFWDAGCAGATFHALTLELLGETPVPLPPRELQQAIARFLDSRTDAIDALLRGANVSKDVGLGHGALARQADLLAEYRQALITAAVTGQIDVSKEAA